MSSYKLLSDADIANGKWRDCVYPSLANSPAWLGVWRAFGWKALYLASEGNPEPGSGIAVLAKGRGPFIRLQVSIDGLPAPSLVSKNDGDSLHNGLAALRSLHPFRATWVDYHNESAGETLPRGWNANAVATLTRILNSPIDFDPDIRRRLRSSETLKLVLRPAETLRDASLTYELMRQVYARHGSRPRYPLLLYSNLVEVSQNADSNANAIHWRICESDGVVIGAQITLLFDKMALSWQPYIDWNARAVNPGYALMAEAIEWAVAVGATVFNFGGTPSSASGVANFKEKFGGEPYSYRVLTYQSPLARLTSPFARTR